MKRTIVCALCSVVFGLCIGAQTTNTAAANSVATPDAKSANQDLNIRAYMELLQSDIRRDKAQIVGQVMQLDAEQAAKFWPVYRSYEADLSKIGDDIVSLIKTYVDSYDNMTSQTADELALKLLDIERKRIELKASYYNKMKSALDAITAARFLQVENQLEKLLDLQIAANLPVIQ